jgi:hypothetical protein
MPFTLTSFSLYLLDPFARESPLFADLLSMNDMPGEFLDGFANVTRRIEFLEESSLRHSGRTNDGPVVSANDAGPICDAGFPPVCRARDSVLLVGGERNFVQEAGRGV